MIERRKHVETDGPEHIEDRTPAYLALATTVMIFLALLLMMFFPIVDKNEHLITQLITALIGAWGLATGFYLNTNKNAAKAQDTMNKQAETAKRAGVALAAVAAAAAAPADGTVTLAAGDSVKVDAEPVPPK